MPISPPDYAGKKVKRNLKFIVITAICIISFSGLWSLTIAAQPEIKTSAGNLIVTKARFTDSFPQRCTSSDPTCTKAATGYQILVLHLKPKVRSDLEELFHEVSGEIYVIANDGSRTGLYSQHTIFSPPRILLAFVVEDVERSYQVVWPGNSATDLTPILFLLP